VVTVVGEEGGHADGGVEGVVVREFGHWEEVMPVVLSIVAEGSKILLEDLVDSLRLSVRLGVEGCREVGLDVQEAFDFGPPLGGKA
jgi:hypothetical protein